MPRPSRRSRTLRRVHKRIPGGKTKLTYEKRKPSRAVCSACKQHLHGVPRERPYKQGKLTKSRKRPERAYGGMLCSRCSRREIIKKARVQKND